MHGTLKNTALHFIENSQAGYFASELRKLLKVRIQDVLFALYSNHKVYREQVGWEYLYMSIERWSEQLDNRKRLIEAEVKEKELSLISGYKGVEVQGALQLFLSSLNEKQRRLYVGFESMKLGRGGDSIMSMITGMDIKTIGMGRKELLSHNITVDRIRQEGGGRHSLKKTDILIKIEELIEDDTAGNPLGSLKWLRKSTYTISRALYAHGIAASPKTTGSYLKDMSYSLKSNRKTIAETKHPDRNQQFNIIAETRKRFEDDGQPIISVDNKKKKLIGNFKNLGRTWKRMPEEVFTHDFRSKATAIANPYGIYDTTTNNGTIVVGTSYDTPKFAVESIELILR